MIYVYYLKANSTKYCEVSNFRSNRAKIVMKHIQTNLLGKCLVRREETDTKNFNRFFSESCKLCQTALFLIKIQTQKIRTLSPELPMKKIKQCFERKEYTIFVLLKLQLFLFTLKRSQYRNLPSN